MFTGLVTAVGRVRDVARRGDRVRLTIEAPYRDLEMGESIAVAGACLTVVELADGVFSVDVVTTTRGRTRLADLAAGQSVNLERALRAADRMGGHFVQGHVDAVVEVVAVSDQADALVVDLKVPADLAVLAVPHGSITVDGVSLTVNAIPRPGVVQLSLIPYTRQHTTLGALKAGDRVHVEGDVLGKFVRQLMHPAGERT
ncbi:MAG TPA: riboflavin synthase [Gemmatimonadales bacterium]